MEIALTLLLGFISGGLVFTWLFVRKIEKYLDNDNKKWFYTARIYYEGKLMGWHSGVISLFDLDKSTPADISNYIVTRTNELGKKVDKAEILLLTKWK